MTFDLGYYSPLCIMELGDLGMVPACQSVHLSILGHSSTVAWVYFLNSWYHDQVPWATNPCKIEFGYVPNLSNSGNFVIYIIMFVWYLREEWADFVHIWYSNHGPCIADACKITFGSLPNLSNDGNFVINVVCLLWNLREEWWICSYLVQ